MLINFKCSNYYAFADEVSFTSSVNNSLSPVDVSRYHKIKNCNFSKASIIYGKNGTGKTKFIKAMMFVKEMVINSSKETQEGEEIEVEPFKLSDKTTDSPTAFEISFLNDGVIYRFGFSSTKERIIEEYLYCKFEAKNGHFSKRETKLYYRKEEDIDLGKLYNSVGKFVYSSEITLRNNSLLLSFSAQVGHSLSKSIISWFRRLRFSLGGGRFSTDFTAKILENTDNELYPKVLEFLDKADLGFSGISSKEIEIEADEVLKAFPKDMQPIIKSLDSMKDKIQEHLIFTHHAYTNSKGEEKVCTLNLEDESEGINKMVSLAGPVVDSIKNGYILLIDEIETNLHYQLVKNLIKIFNSSYNENRGQIICTTNNPLLMNVDIMNRDQMWILNKNKSNITKLSRVSESKFKVRKDTNIFQKIIDGGFNSEPNLV